MVISHIGMINVVFWKFSVSITVCKMKKLVWPYVSCHESCRAKIIIQLGI